MTKPAKGFLLVSLSAAGFSAMPIFARLAYHHGVNIFELLTVRFLIAGLVLAAYLQIKPSVRPLSLREKGAAAVMGFCGYAVASLCFFGALQRIPVPLASILLYAYPVLVTVFAALAGTERFDRNKAAALLLSALGIFLVFGLSFNTANPEGMALALLAALFYSGYVLIGNWALREAPLVAATGLISFSAATGIGLYGLLSGQMFFTFGVGGWTAVAGLAFFSTVVAVLAFLQGVVLIGASRASIISMLEPPLTVIMAAVFLAETLTLVQLLGGLLILLSAVLVNRKQQGTLGARKFVPRRARHN
jgi:drug/metabolite transporter (DMT)-like permease